LIFKLDLNNKQNSFIISIYTIIRDKLKFANPKDIKDEVDAQILALLGPKVNDGKKSVPKKATTAPASKTEVEKPLEPGRTFILY
jgi:non-homologous end joining protein Ku